MTEREYLEYRLDENVLLVLDHRSVEIFDAAETVISGGHSRWHVDHLGVDAVPSREGTEVTIGLRMPNGDIRVTGGRVKFTATDEQMPHVLAFFDRAKFARTPNR